MGASSTTAESATFAFPLPERESVSGEPCDAAGATVDRRGRLYLTMGGHGPAGRDARVGVNPVDRLFRNSCGIGGAGSRRRTCAPANRAADWPEGQAAAIRDRATPHNLRMSRSTGFTPGPDRRGG